MADFSLTSPVFSDGEMIPVEYTCEGENVSPPLTISNVPEKALSLAIIVEDPDIPEAVKEQMDIEVFDHWIVYNIPPSVQEVAPGVAVGTPGVNSGDSVGYTGPCPPAEHEPTEHRYVFTLYALDVTLELPEGASKSELKTAMQDHVIGTCQLVGRYEMQSVS